MSISPVASSGFEPLPKRVCSEQRAIAVQRRLPADLIAELGSYFNPSRRNGFVKIAVHLANGATERGIWKAIFNRQVRKEVPSP